MQEMKFNKIVPFCVLSNIIQSAEKSTSAPFSIKKKKQEPQQ